MDEHILAVTCDLKGCPNHSLIVNEHKPPGWLIERERQLCPKHRPKIIPGPKG